MPNARSGDTTSRLNSPMATPFGNLKTRLKSAGVSDSPSATMITTSDSGSIVVTKNDWSSIAPP